MGDFPKIPNYAAAVTVSLDLVTANGRLAYFDGDLGPGNRALLYGSPYYDAVQGRLYAPAFYTTGGPVVSSNIPATSSANTIFAGPTSGAAAAAAFRALVAADIPALDAAKIASGVIATARLGSGTGTTANFLRGDGAFSNSLTGDLLVTGKLGVNNSSPGFQVDIAGQCAVQAARINVNSGNTFVLADTQTLAAGAGGGIALKGAYSGASQTEFAAIVAHKDNSTSGHWGAGLGFYVRAHGTGGWTALGTGGPASSGVAMFIDSAGRVGISTPTPSTLFHVAGAATVDGDFVVGSVLRTYGANVGIGAATWGTLASNVLGIGNGIAPTSSPAGMGQVWVESGALKYRGAGGTVTTLANSADSDAPARDTLRVIKETVFAGLGAASYSNGTTTTIDGCGYSCTIAGNGAVDMVATGLRLRQGTTGSTGFQIMSIAPGNTGNFASLLGEARFRRGKWAVWTRLASYDFTNTSGQVLGVIGELAHLTGTKWAISHRRNRNAQGAPNTTTGGLAIDYWWNGSDINPSSYFGVSSADVICTLVRSHDQMDVYYGTYSGGWPTLESMTFWGTIRASAAGWVANTPTAAGVSIRFYLGGSSASSGTYEIVIDRWRLTTWE